MALKVAIAEGCLIGGVETALGIAVLPIIITKAIYTGLTSNESSLLQEALGIGKEAVKAFIGEIKDIVNQVKIAGSSRDAVYAIRVIGRKVGEFIGSYFTLQGAGAIIKYGFGKLKLGGKINGMAGTIVETGEKTSSKTQFGKIQTFKDFIGEKIPGSIRTKFKAIYGKCNEIGNEIRTFFRRRVDKFVEKGNTKNGIGIPEGNRGFGGTIHAERVATVTERVATVTERVATVTERVATVTERVATVTERVATGTERVATVTIGKGLYFMAKALGNLAEKVRDAYISKQGARVASKITETSGSFAERAREIGLTSQGIRSTSNLRQGRLADWIIPGTMGITFASMTTVTDAVLNTSQTIADYISPDFNDPTSAGAIFWIKSSADITNARDIITTTAAKTITWTQDKLTYAADFYKGVGITLKENIAEFSGFGNPEYYKTDIRYPSVDIAVADMRLDWLNLNERPVQCVADIVTLCVFANKRWSNSVRAGAPELAKLINSGKHGIIMGPGINTMGLSDKQLGVIASKINLKENQTLVILHSAGTELGAKAMPLVTRDKSEVFYLVLSPRMDDSTYASWMKKGNVPPSNVLTINSAKDLPHWSDWSVLTDKDKLNPFTSDNIFVDPVRIFMKNISKFWHDYDYNRDAGTHVFIAKQKTEGEDLSHGCMINGLETNRKFDITFNGYWEKREVDITSVVNMWLNNKDIGGFDRRGK